jgi:hypothetical protein
MSCRSARSSAPPRRSTIFPVCCRAAKPWPIRASSCAISANRRTAGCCSAAARPIRRTIRATFREHIRRQIAEIYPALKCRDHPCLGRLRRHHPAAPAVRARGHARRHLDRRLFRPWRHAVKLLRQALCRYGDSENPAISTSSNRSKFPPFPADAADALTAAFPRAFVVCAARQVLVNCGFPRNSI